MFFSETTFIREHMNHHPPSGPESLRHRFGLKSLAKRLGLSVEQPEPPEGVLVVAPPEPDLAQRFGRHGRPLSATV